MIAGGEPAWRDDVWRGLDAMFPAKEMQVTAEP